MNTQSIKQWHQRKLGLFIFAIVELAIAYGIASLAINDGNLWWYLLIIVLLIGVIRNIVRLTRKFINGNKSRKA